MPFYALKLCHNHVILFTRLKSIVKCVGGIIRDKRLSKQDFISFLQDSEKLIHEENEFIKGLSNLSELYKAYSRNAKDLRESVLAAYSMGEPMEEIASRFYRLLDYLQMMIAIRKQIPNYVKKEYSAYADRLYYLSLGILLVRHEKYWEIIVEYVSLFFDDDHDSLIAVMTNYLENRPDFTNVEKNIRWSTMIDLWQAIEDKSHQRTDFIKKYLKYWYRNNRDAYWYNYHNKLPNCYFGYWCIEAAAIAIMLDLDDSGLRKSDYYPIDMADWARLTKPSL